ncbi:hypothetical protein M422DRAFT_47640 [Sphaerobolus stellatus SS14]|uniref:Uncharacterized protein n=1 Tax=Sphaerobolus stellatus (strain SS14) TaxID=990650 RepID=A0A0C9VPQ7_SPHS4|nr:hypothetical protein M422DRAFT_47640 [Sphaerobolus stellatus SS14]
MAGEKRSASPHINTRSSKAAKTKESDTATKQAKVLPRSTFRGAALPIHVSFTHTPAPIPEQEDDRTTPIDPGHIGNITLLPSEFSTGSYGWKGARRMTLELQGSEGEEKKKVQVMININATVVGSKGAAGDEDEDKEDESTPVEEAEEKP